jgi:hypothetical protein
VIQQDKNAYKKHWQLKEKFIDERGLYKNYKDLNDWIMHFGQTQKQAQQLKQ